MATYNFSQISDFEFESLCRDLLQAELGHSLELFAPGPDGGIDIRYVGEVDGEGHTIVAQCKRWDENSFNNLLRHLSRVELPKIQELAPDRYIVMTSVRLTPIRKKSIFDALQPWVKIPSDVIGRDDLSGLLAKHQARLYAKFRGSNGCHHVGTPPLMAGVGGFFTIRCQR